MTSPGSLKISSTRPRAGLRITDSRSSRSSRAASCFSVARRRIPTSIFCCSRWEVESAAVMGTRASSSR